MSATTNNECVICNGNDSVGIATGPNGIEKLVCSVCDIDGSNYNGWGDEEESEYMCELIECFKCECNVKRKDMAWRDYGYLDVCNKCDKEDEEEEDKAETILKSYTNKIIQERLATAYTFTCRFCEENKFDIRTDVYVASDYLTVWEKFPEGELQMYCCIDCAEEEGWHYDATIHNTQTVNLMKL